MTSSFDIIAKLTASIISEASKAQGRSEKLIVEVSKASEEWHTAEVKKRSLAGSVMAACTPGYFNGEGAAAKAKPEELARLGQYAVWGTGPVDFEKTIAEYQSAGLLKSFEIRT